MAGSKRGTLGEEMGRPDPAVSQSDVWSQHPVLWDGGIEIESGLEASDSSGSGMGRSSGQMITDEHFVGNNAPLAAHGCLFSKCNVLMATGSEIIPVTREEAETQSSARMRPCQAQTQRSGSFSCPCTFPGDIPELSLGM